VSGRLIGFGQRFEIDLCLDGGGGSIVFVA
jgi:hypothetical protein